MNVIAYQAGVLYPGFESAPRATLGRVFERFGFGRAAHGLVDIDPHRALSTSARRVGAHRKDGLRVQPLQHKSREHVLAFQIEETVQRGRESAGAAPGARIFSNRTGGIVVGPAPNGSELPSCMALAERIRTRAVRLLSDADTRAVSRAVNSMIEEARAFRFIARGSYMLRAGDPVTERVVGCLREIRSSFYDETTRAGIRAAVVEILDHRDNARAVRDAVTDDAERQVAVLVQQLQIEACAPNVRRETLEKRRCSAEALLESLSRLSPLLVAGGELIETTRAVMAAYEKASSGAELSVPFGERATLRIAV